MNQPHEIADKEVIPAQVICFILASLCGFAGSYLLHTQVIFKFGDAFFITACILVAMKLARKGWDLPAAGFTVLSIAWGVFFLAKDFKLPELSNDIFASAFYFLLPSMILIAMYKPFPNYIKILTLFAILPSLFALIAVKTDSMIGYLNIIREFGYQIIHVVSLFWGVFYYQQYKKSRKN